MAGRVLCCFLILAFCAIGYCEFYNASVANAEDIVERVSQGGKRGKILLGAFNIQIFGENKMGQPDIAAVLVKILRRYDVAVVMEIRDDKEKSFPQFISMLNKGKVKYEYVESERLGRSSSKEQYAFLYDPNVITLVSTYQYTNDSFERPPFVATFKGGSTVFNAIVVHTKPSDATEEIDALTDVYDKVTAVRKNKNAIIMGDFNAGCAYFPKYKRPQTRLYNQKRFTWLIDDETDTTVGQTKCPYDRFVVAGDMINNVVKNSAQPFDFPSAYKLDADFAETVSDHYPIEVQLVL